ncbi:MAG: ATP-dependent helicase [Bacteroides sp.]|nr:MAG: ATP-dependent helicase [Bacteroides sp.]
MANNCDIKYNFFYKNLNNQQNIAVNNLYGPILVIAGPGTGKTQIIAMRIGKILMETDTLSNNILCITYTESGANSIRQRLLECIGNEAYKVNIYTFHSFCNFIIRDNLDYWSNIDLIPINQIEKINILKSIIDELPFNSTLKRFNGDIYFDIYRLNNLFSIIKRENWNIKDIILKSKEYLDKTIYTIDGFFYKKSRNKKLTISGLTEKKRINQLIDAINLFPTYIDKMAQLNRYDFDDMIIWTINLLKNKPDILKNLQERYSHILIDEYQDTNESQNFILNQLISFWKNPDIFVVGDDDQSIFKFQGASVKNMAFFIEKYRNFDLKIVVLNKNYRSNHYIIKLSDILINNNQNRIHNKYDTINKKLIPSNTNLKNCKPQIIEYNSVYDELYSTAKYIKTLIKNKYVNPNDIAIIYRNHNLIEPLLIYFDKLNIKYNVKHNNNALNVKIIKQIISIMSYVNNEINDPYSGEDILYKIMHYDFIGINSISIAKISVFLKNYNHNTFLRNFIYSVDKNKNLKNVLNKNEINSLKKLSIKIEIIIKNALENTIQETLEDIIYKFNILNFVMKSSHYEKYINSMNSFIRYIQESINRNSNIDLNQTINNINTMYKYKISIDYNKSMDTNCINCLTAHASKGKEFKYVFLILSNECYWISKKKIIINIIKYLM